MPDITQASNRSGFIHPLAWLLAALAGMVGCGGPADIPGGTPGRIHVENLPLREVQVTFYETSGSQAEPIAFGISDSNGHFELRERETLEGVWLTAGNYRVTLESVGEIYMRWPEQYTRPDRSPLEVEWSGQEETLDLNVPEPRAPGR
jgi:hypothetical protein